jgi:uncharacterized membrane protein YgcG
LAALTIALGATLAPALARDSYIIDNAQLLKPATVSALNAKIADLYAVAHKEVVVAIEPKVTAPPQEAAEQLFSEQRVNGILVFIALSPKTIGIIPDQASEQWFPAATTSAIRQAIASAFNSGDFDGGVTNGVDLILAQYRSHLGAVRQTAPAAFAAPVAVPAYVQTQTGGGFNMSVIWWLIALAVIFFIVRGVFRAMSGPRMYPPGYGGGPAGPGPMGGGYGPGYGGGYGPGYGYGGGGGGGFWSGMLGGLGGAFLGNELFGGNRTEIIEQNPGMAPGAGGGDWGGGNPVDTSGFQSDPGQADMGNASFGGWGGGDSGGGWGDTGGGGGDFGGGGGDNSGGGW